MEDGDTGHCIDSDSGTDCDGNDIMYGPRPTRNLKRNLLISQRPQSPNEVADFSFSSNPPLCHIKHSFILNFPKKVLNMNLDWNIITIFAQN